MTPRAFLPAATALILAIFVAATLIIYPLTRPARVDFTQNALFTLSPETRSVLDTLEEPIELTFVYTRQVGQDYPQVRAYAARVRELLDSYSAVAGANLKVTEIDPKPFSEAEDQALAAGIDAVDTEGDDPLYFGIIGQNTVDEQRVLAFLAPEREETLEYDLTRLIARLDRPDPPKIGLLTTLPGMGADSAEGGYTLLQEMKRSFDVEPVAGDFYALPDDLDALIMIHPPELTEWQSWVIDQFVLRTGRVVMLVDAAAKTSPEPPSRRVERRIRSDLGRFGPVWGVTLAGQAIADTETALPIQAPTGSGRTGIIRHPLYLSTPPSMMSQDSILTAPLSRSVNFASSGALVLNEASPIDKEVLIETGTAPSWIDPETAMTDIGVEETLALYEPTEGARALGVRVHGTLVSAFPDGRPEPVLPEDPVMAQFAAEAIEQAQPHVSSSEREAEILILADADLVDDGLYIDMQRQSAFADNGALIMNALDMMSGNANLLSLRARASSRRTMTRVEAMRDEAQARFFEEQAQLEAQLAESEARLQELLQIDSRDSALLDSATGASLSAEQQEELAQLRSEVLATRERLRSIERDFRRDIDGLEGWLKFINIFAGAILIGAVGCFVWWRRRKSPA
jgi:ABC-2 type transport system permease protein